MQGWIQPGWGMVKGHSRWTDRLGWATGCTIVVHVAGTLGILFFDRQTFISMTPVNLLLMQALAWWTFAGSAKAYARALAVFSLLGMSVEWVGVHTGLLFGTYSYTDVLGLRLASVPLLIGGNWFLVLAGSLSCAVLVHRWVLERSGGKVPERIVPWLTSSIPFLSAGVATVFDRLMEPAAMKLGFWVWADGHVPIYNYICWFGVSYLAFRFGGELMCPAATAFARRLLLVQAIFFLLVGFSR